MVYTLTEWNGSRDVYVSGKAQEEREGNKLREVERAREGGGPSNNEQ